MKTYAIATIPGDGIGKEVVPAGQRVLEALAAESTTFRFEFENFGWGGDWFRAHGEMMPADGLDALRGKDAILFGSAGDPHIPDHITLWGLRLKICQGFDQYANVRPTRILPGIDAPLKRCGPNDLDWVIVRENSEGEYAGVGGRAHQGHPIEVATDVSMMTRAGVERIMRFAFRLAESRPRKHLTVVTKSNAQRHAMVMWDEIAAEVAKEFPDVRWDKELVDAMTARMVNKPASLDTIVATNLHADILSDLAAALAGSLGIAPTGNIDPERRYPSMFEPIHGSAFDIMGKGLANPVGTFWSVVMLLEHLGEAEAAKRLMQAIEQVTANPALHTGDLGGTATTAQVTDAVCERSPRRPTQAAVAPPERRTVSSPSAPGDKPWTNSRAFAAAPARRPVAFAFGGLAAGLAVGPGLAEQADHAGRALPARRHHRRAGALARPTSCRQSLGQPVIVESKPGAAPRSAPTTSPRPSPTATRCSSARCITRSPRASTRSCPTTSSRDFVPMTTIALVPNVLVVNAGQSGEDAWPSWWRRPRREPGKLNYGSNGNGTAQHLIGTQFENLTGTDSCTFPTRAAVRW